MTPCKRQWSFERCVHVGLCVIILLVLLELVGVAFYVQLSVPDDLVAVQ